MRPLPSSHRRAKEREERGAHASPDAAPRPGKQKSLHTITLNALVPTSPSLIPRASLYLIRGCRITNMNLSLSQNPSLAHMHRWRGSNILYRFLMSAGIIFRTTSSSRWQQILGKAPLLSCVKPRCTSATDVLELHTRCSGHQTGRRRDRGQLHRYLYLSTSILRPPNYRPAPRSDSLLHRTSSLPPYTKRLHAALYFDVACKHN